MVYGKWMRPGNWLNAIPGSHFNKSCLIGYGIRPTPVWLNLLPGSQCLWGRLETLKSTKLRKERTKDQYSSWDKEKIRRNLYVKRI
jgi:hypothetical protein